MLSGREEADGGALRVRLACQRRAVEPDFPASGIDEAGQQFQQCGFARAVGTEQGNAFAAGDLDLQVPERPEVAVGFGKLVNGYAQR